MNKKLLFGCRYHLSDSFLYLLGCVFTALVLLLLMIIFLTLLISSLPSIKAFGWGFLISKAWNPITQNFGALVPIYGTFVTSLIALLFALPFSLAVAYFIAELSSSKLKNILSALVGLLASVPSIIYGIWGLFVLAPFFSKYIVPLLHSTLGKIPYFGLLFSESIYGIGIFTAGIILAIMILPFMTMLIKDAFLLTPHELKESAYSLGMTQFEVFRKVTAVYCHESIIGAIMLGFGRAIGETMAVTFVIGNAHRFHISLLMPGNTISATIANEFTEADTPLHTAALLELGLIVFIISTLILIIARYLLRRLQN